MPRNQRLGLLAIAALIAVVAIVITVAGGDDGGSNGTPTATSEPTPAGAPEPENSTATEPRTTVIHVADGKPVGGVKKLSVTHGERIRFTVVSDDDTADEVHLHGYDVHKDLAAGGRVTFSLQATIEGGFEAELEDAKAPILELDVAP